MKLKINRAKKINTIKNAFSEEFPFLKLEFFQEKHNVNEPSPASEMIQGNISLGEIHPAVKEGDILITSQLTVAKLEQDFKNEFGLFVQVFRKLKDVWIETTKTDNLTLDEQNEIGKSSSVPVAPAKIGDRYLEDGQY